EAGDVHNARHGAELALQHPILERLDVVARINLAARSIFRSFQDVAVDFAGGRLGRYAGGHAGRQRLGDRGQPVDHLLPGRLVGVAVVPIHFEVAEAEQRLAPDRLQTGHTPERYLEGDGDLPLDLFRGSPGEQGNDLNDGRRRVRVSLDVDIHEGVRADARERDSQQDDDQRIVHRPVNDFTNYATPNDPTPTRVSEGSLTPSLAGRFRYLGLFLVGLGLQFQDRRFKFPRPCLEDALARSQGLFRQQA